MAFSTSIYLENAAVNGDQKPSLLQAMAEWVQAWKTERLPNSKKVYVDSRNWFRTCQNSPLSCIAY